MKILMAPVLILLLASVAYSKEKNKSTEQAPIAWGLISQNKGCVIFREYLKIHRALGGFGAIPWIVGELQVVETQNYNLERKKWLETQENLAELTKLAQKDKIKFVKIPEKYSDELLEKARKMCKEPTIPAQ
jgi:hypothetical protein